MQDRIDPGGTGDTAGYVVPSVKFGAVLSVPHTGKQQGEGGCLDARRKCPRTCMSEDQLSQTAQGRISLETQMEDTGVGEAAECRVPGQWLVGALVVTGKVDEGARRETEHPGGCQA